MKKNEMNTFVIILAIGLLAAAVLPKLLRKPKEVNWKDEHEAREGVDWVKNFLSETEPFE